MEQSARRQILADLGIVPWQLRILAGSTGSARAIEADAAAGDPRSTDHLRSAASEPAASGPAAPEPAAPEPAAPEPAASEAAAPELAASAATPRPAASPREEPWSVLSLVCGGALLLVAGDAPRRDLRLAMDVLGAAAGDFRAKPVSRRFDWPPPGAEETLAAGGPGSAGARALLAFVDKDLADHGVRRVLCSAGVEARLPPLPDGIDRVTVPELAALGQDPDAKRALWRTLKRGAG